jgi:hypothetical protein
MSGFEDRKKNFENKFAHDENVKFRIVSRRRKLFGLWVGKQTRLPEEKRDEFAMELVRLGIEDTSEGAVIRRVMSKLKEGGVEIPEMEVRAVMNDLDQEARSQIMAEYSDED